MIKMDLKDAYLQVPVHEAHQCFLLFAWEGKHYKFQSLPFGLSSAPRVFTKLLKPVVGLLRQMGLCLIIYLDDILFMHSNRDQLEEMAPLIVSLFEALGLMVNRPKSLLTPTQSIEFLGFLINSHIQRLFLPSEKSRKILQEVAKLLRQQTLTARELAMFIGKVTATSRALWQAPLHYRALQRALNSVIAGNDSQELSDRYKIQVLMNDEMKKDLQWWTTLDLWNVGTPICSTSTPALVLESDASQKGWGARCMETSTGGCWSTMEAQYHINYLELLAAFLALKTFANDQKGLILLRMDNVSAVTYINQKGGTHSMQLCDLALQIWEWCIQRGITLQAEHLPGNLNIVADMESQMAKDRCDWMINAIVFQRIQHSLGPLEIDLFASRLTKQLPRYYSWRPDSEAEAVDAFLQNWAQVRGFADPPWCLIPRCLSQIKQQEAVVVLITPLWPCQSWFPVLLGMLQDYPRRLPSHHDLILNPSSQFIMQQGTPTLVAWPISGNPSFHVEFLHRLQTCSSHHGGTNQHKLQLTIRKMG